MVDETKIREALVSLLSDVVQKARQDALNGTSDIGSIYDRTDTPSIRKIDVEKAEQAIKDIKRATQTKAGARRIVNAIMFVAETVARNYPV